MVKGLRATIFASRLYDLSLGTAAARPDAVPADVLGIPGDGEAGEDGLAWLDALDETADAETLTQARERLTAWIAANRQWRADTWRGDLLGERLTRIVPRFALLTAGAPAAFEAALAASLGRQARHLLRLPAADRAAVDPFRAIGGAIMAARYLPAFKTRLADMVTELVDEIPRRVFPDGGHLARQPARHMMALAALVRVRRILHGGPLACPELLQNAIDRMAPLLRAYLQGDGGFALLNGGGEGDPATVQRLLELTESRAKPAASAPHTGFYRIQSQRSVILFDAGAPKATPLVAGHAGTLAFEMSVGPHRMIVNCGGGPQLPTSLREALRATAAHSTLTVADINSSDLVPGGFGPRRAVNVTARRREHDRSILVEASHDGYDETFGISHRRLLYLARDGLDLRGEDVLDAETGTGRTFDIRFHLHPDVDASLAAGGRSALLRLPTGRGWRLSISDGTLALEESIYAGGATPRPSRQIVITGRHARRRTITKWRIAREG